MNPKRTVSSHKGYRFRDELVAELLSYVKRGVDKKRLNNVVRGYVPVFFPTHLDKRDEVASWLFPFSLGSRNYWWKGEIEKMGQDFANRSGKINNTFAKEVFRRHGWRVEEPVGGISVADKRGRWRYDAYKEKVAIELELSSRSQVFKDAFKFLTFERFSETFSQNYCLER